MSSPASPPEADVFISYASVDRKRVLPIADRLADAGVSVWLDRNMIEGASKWAEEIVQGIEACKILLLMCSDASMRSWVVKQEVQLAAEGRKAFLPLLLEPSSYPDQIRLFLAGWQWIEILTRPVEQWLPEVLRALHRADVQCRIEGTPATVGEPIIVPNRLDWSLECLKKLARFTDQIWPVAAESVVRGVVRGATRGLGAQQPNVEHGFRLGGRVRLEIESARAGHLLLLDEGPENILYCLCPSWFAPDTRIPLGRVVLPQPQSPLDSFLVTGQPGREHLLAILSDEPLGLDWMPKEPKAPARVLSSADIDTLLARLRGLEGDRWTALATHFDVTAP